MVGGGRIATRTLAPGNPLRQSLAPPHLALNSASLFYVLTSRAREHVGLHVDSKDDLARSIGHHRGEVANAREVFNDAKLGKDRGAGADMNADASKVLELPVSEKYLGLSL